jgi:hypothetical protein
MSQNDYIKFKRIATILNTYTRDQPPVLEQQNYIDFKEFTLVNTIPNTKPLINKLTLSGYQKIFNIEKQVTNCPQFILCQNTDSRPNRVPLSTVYFTPIPQPLTIKQMKNAKNLKQPCDGFTKEINTKKDTTSEAIAAAYTTNTQSVCKYHIGQ